MEYFNALWNIAMQFMSIDFLICGVRITFLQMFLFCVLIGLIVAFLRGVFE